MTAAWFSCIFIFDGVTVKTQKSGLQREGGGGGGGISLKEANGDVPAGWGRIFTTVLIIMGLHFQSELLELGCIFSDFFG